MSKKPPTFFDAIPADARNRIRELSKYPTTFLPPFDISAEFPQLVPKVAVVLHPRRVNSPISVKSSKIGGHVYWPAHEEWPTCPDHAGNALIQVMQLTMRGVPTLPFPQDKDLFQMMWCPMQHEDERTMATAKPFFFWRTIRNDVQLLEENQVLLADQDLLEERSVPCECAVFPESAKEYPDVGEMGLTDKEENKLRKEIRNYLQDKPGSDFFGPEMNKVLKRSGMGYCDWEPMSFGSKMDGYPAMIQENKCGNACPLCSKEMQHLVTLSGVEYHRNGWVPLG